MRPSQLPQQLGCLTIRPTNPHRHQSQEKPFSLLLHRFSQNHRIAGFLPDEHARVRSSHKKSTSCSSIVRIEGLVEEFSLADSAERAAAPNSPVPRYPSDARPRPERGGGRLDLLRRAERHLAAAEARRCLASACRRVCSRGTVARPNDGSQGQSGTCVSEKDPRTILRWSAIDAGVCFCRATTGLQRCCEGPIAHSPAS